MYNRLKTMVNQVRNLGSTKWDDHEMVKVIFRSLVFHNPTQVQLIRGDPRYKHMSPKEVIGKFVSFELMIKDSKHIFNLEQGATSTPKVQPVAFKATKEKKEESTRSRLPIDASKLDNEEMALIIKSFHQILKQRRGRTTSPVTESPKSLGPPTVVLIQRTLDNPVDAHNHSTSSISISFSSPKSVSPITQILQHIGGTNKRK
jgi:hypothetical protein